MTRVRLQTSPVDPATCAVVADEHGTDRRARSVRPSSATCRSVQREPTRLSIHTARPPGEGQTFRPVPSSESRRAFPRTAVSFASSKLAAATTPARPATPVTQRTAGGGVAAPRSLVTRPVSTSKTNGGMSDTSRCRPVASPSGTPRSGPAAREPVEAPAEPTASRSEMAATSVGHSVLWAGSVMKSIPLPRQRGSIAALFVAALGEAPSVRSACTSHGSGEGRNRTGDTTVFSRVLYRLSYLAERPTV